MKYTYYILISLLTFCKVYTQEKNPDFRIATNGKYALYSAQGKQLTEPIYTEGKCYYGICVANKKEYKGLLDYKGKEITPFKYSKVEVLCDEDENPIPEKLIAVSSDSKRGLIDYQGKEITPLKYCSICNPRRLGGCFKKGIAQVSINCHTVSRCRLPRSTNGFINTKGKEIIPLMYESVRFWEKSGLITVKKGLSAGLYDTKGTFIVPLGKYNKIDYFDKNGLIKVVRETSEDSYQGYINQKGKEIIPPLYKFKSDFIDGFIYGENAITENEGILDYQGNILIPFEYESVSVLNNGYFKATNDNSRAHSYFNTKGEKLLSIKCNYASDVSPKGYILINKSYYKKDWFIVDIQGKETPIPKYQEVDFYIKNGLVAVKQNNKWGFINTKGKIVVDFIFDKVDRFCNNLARVSQNKKFGYINTKGKIIIPIKFDEADSCFQGVLGLNGKKNYFDKTGKKIKKTIN